MKNALFLEILNRPCQKGRLGILKVWIKKSNSDGQGRHVEKSTNHK